MNRLSKSPFNLSCEQNLSSQLKNRNIIHLIDRVRKHSLDKYSENFIFIVLAYVCAILLTLPSLMTQGVSDSLRSAKQMACLHIES